MKIPADKLKSFLVNEGLVAPELFDEIAAEASRLGQEITDLLISRRVMTEDFLYNFLTQYFGVEKAALPQKQINLEILKKLPEELARKRRAIVFGVEPDGVFDAAMEDPSDLEAIEFLERYLKNKVKPFLATQADLRQGYALYGKELTENFKKIIEENVSVSLRRQLGSEEESAKDLPIVAIVDNLMSYAASLRSSDIHIEILEDSILVRFRIDGILHEIIRMPKAVMSAIIARIKLLSALKIDEHYKPQDGRFRHKAGSEIFDVRVSIIPVFYGEKIVMRLLTATQKPLALEEIGMFEDTKKIVEENIQKTYGMVLVCGPTGSGKTTTLYSILNILNKPEVNIVTIEDPIEYDMKYINQTQINPQAGITFATGLRSILRQDPNIIMVGEIRDEETAEIAVHSALTGHLLLSSLHTNDAGTAVPRLADMKIEPFLISAVLNAVLAQRLARKICLSCIESYAPDEGLSQLIVHQLKEANPYSNVKVPKLLFLGKGCSACHNTGYRGRVAIFEVLNIDDDARKMIANPDFSLVNLNDYAKKKGMITMFEDGLRKAERGIITIEEVMRVIRE